LAQSTDTRERRLFLVVIIVLVVAGGALLAYLFQTGKRGRLEERVVSERIKVLEAPPEAVPPEPAEEIKKKEEPKKPTAPEKLSKEKPSKEKPSEPLPIPKKPAYYKPWAVHFASFSTKKEAAEIKQSLVKKGYNAYITETKIEGITWYRVRVGFYSTKEEAKKSAARFAKEFKNPDAWPVTPNRSEVSKYTK